MDYTGRYWELQSASNSDVLCVQSGKRPAVTQACAVCHKLHPDRPLQRAFWILLAFSWTKGKNLKY